MSKNLTLTTALFFLLGACSPAKLNVTFVYLTELVPERNRTAVGTLLLFADASSMTFLPLYFRFVTKEWIYFQMGSFVMNIIGVIGMLVLIPESPKYLYASGKIQECIQKIRYIAKINGKGTDVIETIEITEVKQKEIKGKLKDLLQDRKLRLNLIIFAVLWVIATFNYYLVYFQIKYMKGDFYINAIVSSCTEMLSYTVSGFLLNILGIKFGYLLSFSTAIIGGALYVTLQASYESLTPIFLFLASFGTGCALNIDWNINSILFPVIFSSSTNGICNVFARISNSLAP